MQPDAFLHESDDCVILPHTVVDHAPFFSPFGPPYASQFDVTCLATIALLCVQPDLGIPRRVLDVPPTDKKYQTYLAAASLYLIKNGEHRVIRADSIFIEAVPEGLKSQRSLLRYQISDRETAKIDSFFLENI